MLLALTDALEIRAAPGVNEEIHMQLIVGFLLNLCEEKLL